MPRWLFWFNYANIYITVSRSIRSTYFWSVGRNSKQLSDDNQQSDERKQPCESDKSCESNERGATCHRHRDTACSAGSHCYANNCRHAKDGASAEYIEREYNEYIAATRSAERQDTSARIWSGDELGDSKRSNSTARTNIEHITGIPTGVTV